MCTDDPKFAVHAEQVKERTLRARCEAATQLYWHPGVQGVHGNLPTQPSDYYIQVDQAFATVLLA